jgi:hypothetical protein
MNFERAINSALPLIAALTLIAGCALPREVSKTPRSATEQLLLTHAVQRALADVTVPLPEGATVAVEVSGLQTDRAHVHMQKEGDFGIIDAPSWDLSFVRDAVAARLGERGYHIKKYAGEATYLVRVMVLALGTNQGNTFFGLPPIQSVIIPFSLPRSRCIRNWISWRMHDCIWTSTKPPPVASSDPRPGRRATPTTTNTPFSFSSPSGPPTFYKRREHRVEDRRISCHPTGRGRPATTPSRRRLAVTHLSWLGCGMNGTKTSPLTIVAALGFAACVCALDVMPSPGWSWAALYVIPVVWIALWSPPDDVMLVTATAIVVTALTFVPCLVPQDGDGACASNGERLIVTGAIWLTVLLSVSRKKTQRTFKWINLSSKR